MAQEEEDEFEEQLRQEELARKAKEEGASLSKGATYVDDDGTVMEWDHERRAYFPKIDADFIAQYQINYGAVRDTSGELTEDQKKAQYDEYWKNYYSVYAQQQPRLPKFDDEGNPIEDEESEEGKEGTREGENKPTKNVSENSSTSQQTFDPTSEEHYQYNLYYYGKEYADAYQEYYQEHPEGEPMPDWLNQTTEQDEQQKKENEKKKKKNPDKGEKRKEPPRPEGWFEMDSESSCQVYVSGLPEDITDEEFKDIMSKCGLILYDPATRQPKLKLYKDADGNYKGDGLCSYIKPESVALALEILDGTELREHTVKVERAKFELKGSFDPAKKKKKLSNKQKQKLKERQQKLFDWRPEKNPFERGKHEKVAILKNMFDIKEFEANPALINEVRADVREECSKFGEVKKVTVYDHNPEGVISVAFKEPEEADACIAALNGRWFAKNRVVALTFDGKTKYDVQETEEEKQKRLNDWEQYLAGGKKAVAEKASSSASGQGTAADEKASPSASGQGTATDEKASPSASGQGTAADEKASPSASGQGSLALEEASGLASGQTTAS